MKTMDVSALPLLFSLLISLFTLFPSCNSISQSLAKHRFPTTPIGRFNVTKPEKIAYEIKYFTQTIDHFNYQPQSYGAFQQRYLIDARNWGGGSKTSAPIFVYTGNEGDIEFFAKNTGFLFDIAPFFNALLVFIEHRYYGESIPFGGNKEVAYQNASTFGYLSSTQALADYATLITDLKKNLTAEKSPVVVFGGSYGGMLAAWFRLKYPHIAIGALASSAPILQFDDIVSPYAFNDIVTKDFRIESENCYKVIKNSWAEIEAVAKQKGGRQKFTQSFKLCKVDVGDEDLRFALEAWIQYAIIYAAMTDYPTPSNFLSPLPAFPVKKMCEAIDNPATGNDTFEKLYGAMNVYYNFSGTSKCFDPTLDTNGDIGVEAWSWQSCTELILPTGASGKDSIFPAANYYDPDEDCQDEYEIAPRPHWIPIEFGAHDITRVLKRFASNIIFFNGLKDPWSGGGVLKSISNSLVAIVAPEGAHHVDLRLASKEDPVWLQNVRKQEAQIITSWLQQYYSDSISG